MNNQTSWEISAHDYSQLVGKTGSYYHRAVIFPQLLQAMALRSKSAVLELGCGQGVFSRLIPQASTYFGLDASPTLIDEARKLKEDRTSYFKVQDVTRDFRLTKTNFDHVVIVLALQNMANLDAVFANAYAHLKPKGHLWMVINHPSFRIPKYTEWQVQGSAQLRVVSKYMSITKIPIDMTPGSKQHKQITWSFHYPLSHIVSTLKSNRFSVADLQEWVSDKQSEGKHAVRENTARAEIPMFMMICATKG